MPSRAHALGALLIAAVLTLAGCSDDPAKPKPLPSSSPSSSAASPAASAPTLPPEAKGTSAASAEAFAHYYFDLINYSARTGDTKPLELAAVNTCQSCKRISNHVRDIYGAGGQIRSRGWILQAVHLVPDRDVAKPVLRLDVYQSPETVKQSSNSSERVFRGGKQPMKMHLTSAASQWRVSRLDLLQ